MNNLKLLFVLTLFALGMASCGGDDCDDLTQATTEITDALQVLFDAETAFSNDDSEANCAALRDAAEDYVDVLNDFQDCTELAASIDFEGGISSTEAIIDDLPC